MRERLRECCANHLARVREGSIPVIGLSEEPLCTSVNHHIPGTSVQSDNVARVSTRRNDGQVRYAADILQKTQSLRMSVEGDVEKWNKGSAFSAGSHVGWTKIGDNGNLQAVSNYRGFACLPRCRNW